MAKCYYTAFDSIRHNAFDSSIDRFTNAKKMDPIRNLLTTEKCMWKIILIPREANFASIITMLVMMNA